MAIMATLELNNVNAILREYNLKSNKVETIGKVSKVSTSNGIYALKAMQENSDLSFVNKFEKLYRSGYTSFVPIYKTVNGKYFVQNNHQLYYLMPWINDDQERQHQLRHEQYFSELARLHMATVKDQKIAETEVEQHYKELKSRWDERRENFEAYIDNCERKIYMSPFELQFATLYHETMQACQFARSRLDDWYKLAKEKKKVRASLTLGKASATNFLFDHKEKVYFTSYEKAKIAPPFNDLVGFYYKALRAYPVKNDESYQWFTTYTNLFPLEEEEVQLFLSYLAYPEPIYRCVENYVTNRSTKSELVHVKHLQRAYWLNKNIESLASRIHQEEQIKKEQQQMEQMEQEYEKKMEWNHEHRKTVNSQ
jgi:spore coat protein YsxE